MTTTLLNESEKPGKQHYQILFMSWAGWVFDFYDLMLFTFLLMPIGKELHLSDLQLSFILGSCLAATAIGGVIFGWLCDKLGRKLILQMTILIYSIGTFLSGLAPSLELLLIFRIITGLGVGGEWATGQTYIGETFPAKMRGRFGAFMQTGAPIGIAIAAVVGGYIEPVIGWRACFFISILPAIIVIFIRKSLPESDLWAERKKIASLKKDDGKKSETENKLKILFSKQYRKLFILALVLAIFDMSAYWFTYSWLPGYLHQQRNMPIAKSTLWLLVTQLGGLIGYSTFGFVSDKTGRRPAYTIYSFIMAVGLVMITLMWDVIAVNPFVILIFMFLVGFGTGMFGGYGPLFSELFPTKIRSTAMGSAFNLARGIQFFTPVVISLVAVRYGLSGGISLAALFAILTGIWIWTFPETKGKKLYVEIE
ncbi:MAG: MFS transporter [Bacteroidetes bacterium]|nr:MAG: MFS transporter [Bacteroidota bacterium]